MSKILELFFILYLSAGVLAENPPTVSNFSGKSEDAVLLSHYNYLTRYQHSFEGLPKGDCGNLFDLAVEQFKKYLREEFAFSPLNILLESSSFDANQCQHVYESYSWVLLYVYDNHITCEVHMPLDLRNLDLYQKEAYPLLHKPYAEKAIREKDSWCYSVDETGLKREIFYMPETMSLLNDDEPLSDAHEHFSKDSPFKISLSKFNKSGDSLEEISEEDNNDDEDDERPRYFQQSIYIDEEFDDRQHTKSKQHRRKGILITMDECTQEDKMRILDLYAAEITKDKAAGYVIYTENIHNCKAGHDKIDTYTAEIRLNDHSCDFNVINDTNTAGLMFLPNEAEGVISCKDFRGLN